MFPLYKLPLYQLSQLIMLVFHKQALFYQLHVRLSNSFNIELFIRWILIRGRNFYSNILNIFGIVGH